MEGPADSHKQDDEQLHLKIVEDKVKEYPLKDRIKLIALHHQQKQKQLLDEQLDKQITDIQKQYDLLSLPIYAEQKALIVGERAPSQEEIKQFSEFFTEAELQEAKQLALVNEPIDNFWGQALTNCNSLQGVWGEKDKEILKYLTSIEVEMSADTPVFTLRFTFKDNEYFTNKELTKKFIIEGDEQFPKKTIGTQIDWQEGKDVTVKMVEKKQKNKKTGATRIIKKKEDQESFFNFFKNTEDVETDQAMEDDYEMGKTIAEEVIPYCLEYYLGINPDEEDFEDVDDEDDDDGEDNEDDDDDEEDDHDKKKKAPRKKSGESNKSEEDGDDDKKKKKQKRKKSEGEGKGDKKPDCKQQ